MISSFSHWQRRRHSPRHVIPSPATEAVATVSFENAWAQNGLVRGTSRNSTREEECNGDQVRSPRNLASNHHGHCSVILNNGLSFQNYCSEGDYCCPSDMACCLTTDGFKGCCDAGPDVSFTQLVNESLQTGQMRA